MPVEAQKKISLSVEIPVSLNVSKTKKHQFKPQENAPGYGSIRYYFCLEMDALVELGDDEAQPFRDVAYAILRELGDVPPCP